MRDEIDRAERYEIRVRGHLDQRWSRWFEGMEISYLPDGVAVLKGLVIDQAALQGVLARIGELGLELLLVRRVEQVGQAEQDKSGKDKGAGR